MSQICRFKYIICDCCGFPFIQSSFGETTCPMCELLREDESEDKEDGNNDI